jgi:6-phosphogluconolactonase
VADSALGAISTYAVNSTTGALSSVGVPINFGRTLSSTSFDPSGKFAYVSDQSANKTFIFGVDGDSGALSLLGSTSGRRGTVSFSMSRDLARITRLPRFAYIANQGSGDVSAFTIDARSGALAYARATATGQRPVALGISPFGKYVYAVNQLSSTVSQYSINDSNGGLAAIGPDIATGAEPGAIAIESSGRFAYVTNKSAGTVSPFAIDANTGKLASIGVPVAAGTTPQSLTVDPAGQFAYMTNGGSNNISSFSINPASGSLVAIGTVVAAGNAPQSVTGGSFRPLCLRRQPRVE